MLALKSEAIGRPARPWTAVRRITRPLAGLLCGTAFLCIIELVLGLLQWPKPAPPPDPFVGFKQIVPLFVLNEAATDYQIAPARRSFFRPDSFLARKPPNEFRIFVLGGSTVQGRPYAIETSFTTFLELSLNSADPSRQWQVVSCGGVSYASYRLVPILNEVLNYEPDLVILYTGQNEFLEDRGYGHIRRMPDFAAGLFRQVTALHSYELVRRGLATLGYDPSKPRHSPVQLATEVDALLDYKGGLEFYHHDPDWHRGVMAHYELNLRRMIALARDAGVPVMLANPSFNLRDCPPFKSEHRPDLTDGELQRWEALWKQARELYRGDDLKGALDLLVQARAIDNWHAGIHYEIAKCLDGMRLLESAKASYMQAKERDVCPLRILEPMNRIVLQVAADTDTPVLDVRQMFEQISADGILDNNTHVDHIHPSIRGHQLIAQGFLELMVRQGMLQPAAGWQARRDQAYRAHMASLGDLYFARFEVRLEGLRRWAEGRVGLETQDQPPAQSGQPTVRTREHEIAE